MGRKQTGWLAMKQSRGVQRFLRAKRSTRGRARVFVMRSGGERRCFGLRGGPGRFVREKQRKMYAGGIYLRLRGYN